ncbi:Serine/threonine kinase mps1 [Glugoides intestinalis]
MHLPVLPQNTKDLLEFLRNLSKKNPQELISIYTQSLTLLTDDIHSLFVFLDYMNLIMNFSELDEIEHLYTLFKVKLRKYKIFWINYLTFEVENRRKEFDLSFAKIIDYLKFKAFEGKEELLTNLLDEQHLLKEQLCKSEKLTPTEKEKVVIPVDNNLHDEALQSISTDDFISSSIFNNNKDFDNLVIRETSANINDIKSNPKINGITPKSTEEDQQIQKNDALVHKNLNNTALTMISTPSGVKTSTDFQKGFSTTYQNNGQKDIVYKERKTDLQHKSSSIVFELDLSRSQDISKLRFSPTRRVPFRAEQIKKEEKRRFVDILSASKENAFACEVAENTTVFGSTMTTVHFKDKELFLISKIGKGGYSSVYRVCYGAEIYALKQIRVEDQEGLGICMDEIELLKKLSNYEFVIKMIDYEVKDEVVNILLEYGEIDLQKLVKSGRLCMFQIKYIWESILKILIFIHSSRIVHRDIKPANFVFVGGKLKIIDFGISKSIKGDTTSILNFEKAGTLNYISPEQCSGKKVGRAADVWAAGCILYYMIYRKNIHNAKTVMDVLRMMAEEAEIEYGEGDLSAIESIRACLVYDPKKREKPENLLNYSFLKK